MDLNARKEQFSNAFVLATAAAAGCSTARPSVDNDSLDWTLSNRLPGRPRLDVQLKCTATDDSATEFISFALKRKNYDDLTLDGLICPRILVVVVVPGEIADWMAHSAEQLALRRCAYWVSLAAQTPAGDSATSVTVYLPRSQMFTVEALSSMMDRVSRGEAI